MEIYFITTSYSFQIYFIITSYMKYRWLWWRIVDTALALDFRYFSPVIKARYVCVCAVDCNCDARMRPGPCNNINNQLYQQFCRASPIQMWLISRRMAGSSQWTRILVKIHLHCCCIETQKFPQNDAMSNVAATICTTGWIVGHRTMHMLTGVDNCASYQSNMRMWEL